MGQWATRARELMEDCLAGRLSVEDFTAEYEHLWNFDPDRAELSARDLAIYERLFDVAAWYTPVAEDRAAYPGHKDEHDVLDAIRRAEDDLE
jgi:hypothetical protein